MSSFVAFFSGADKYGRWVPESEITASAYLGGATVDFSQALFQHPVITISSTAFMGAVTLIVPPALAVEQDGAAIFGGFGDNGGIWSSSQSSGLSGRAPVTLRVVGTALMGRVNVVVNPRAPPAQLLSPEEVARILREVPATPSTTVSDLLGQALNQQAQASGSYPQPDPRQALLQGLAASAGAAATASASPPSASSTNSASNTTPAVVQGVPVSAPNLKELD